MARMMNSCNSLCEVSERERVEYAESEYDGIDCCERKRIKVDFDWDMASSLGSIELPRGRFGPPAINQQLDKIANQDKELEDDWAEDDEYEESDNENAYLLHALCLEGYSAEAGMNISQDISSSMIRRYMRSENGDVNTNGTDLMQEMSAVVIAGLGQVMSD